MLAFESRYRDEVSDAQPIWWLGLGLFKVWLGRFYLGFWGLAALIFGSLGSLIWFYKVVLEDGAMTGNPIISVIRGQIPPPSPSIGLEFTLDPAKGMWWQLTVICATLTFIAWMMRQIDISRNLKMSYHVQLAYGAVV